MKLEEALNRQPFEMAHGKIAYIARYRVMFVSDRDIRDAKKSEFFLQELKRQDAEIQADIDARKLDFEVIQVARVVEPSGNSHYEISWDAQNEAGSLELATLSYDSLEEVQFQLSGMGWVGFTEEWYAFGEKANLDWWVLGIDDRGSDYSIDYDDAGNLFFRDEWNSISC